MFEDLEGVEVIVNGILVCGNNEQQHDDRLIQVLERARHQDMKLDYYHHTVDPGCGCVDFLNYIKAFHVV